MDRLQEEVRSLQGQQKQCLKQQDKILQLLSALENALIGPGVMSSQTVANKSTEDGGLQFELYKMKVNQVEKELQDKSQQVKKLQRKVDKYQKHIFKKFDKESHQLYSELRNIQETCSHLASTVISVKEEFDKMWLRPPTITKLLSDEYDVNKYQEKKLNNKEYFSWDDLGEDLVSAGHMTTHKIQPLVRTLSQSDDSLERTGAAAARPDNQTDKHHGKMGRDAIGIRENVSYKATISKPTELSQGSAVASSKVDTFVDVSPCYNGSLSELREPKCVDMNSGAATFSDHGNPNTKTEDPGIAAGNTPLKKSSGEEATVSSLSASSETERDIVEMFHPQWEVCKSILLNNNVPTSFTNIKKLMETFRVGLDRVRGLDTMIILDISGSMEGQAIQQAKTFVMNFLIGLQDLERNDDLKENVGIVTVGHETRVLVSLTSDYAKIKNEVAGLEAGGKTPLRFGLILGTYVIDNHGGRITMTSGHVICPRIIVVSDGNITSDCVGVGPDVVETGSSAPNLVMMKSMLLTVVERIGSANYPIQTIAVGDADKDFLRCISELSRARVYDISQSFILSQYHKFQFLLSHLVPDPLSSENPNDPSVISNKEILLMLINPKLTQDERIEVLNLTSEIWKRERENCTCSIEGGLELDNLPVIGLRVCRGPDWTKGYQDTGGIGTITAHSSKQTLAVRWDNGTLSRYRYGLENKYDVILVDEPRILSNTELIAVGVQVMRGPDWKYKNQDGGPTCTGIVYKVLNTGQCRVRWSNGYKDIFNFGNNGLMELEIVSPIEASSSPGTQPDQISSCSDTVSVPTHITTPQVLNVAQGHISSQHISQSTNITGKQQLNIVQNSKELPQSTNIANPKQTHIGECKTMDCNSKEVGSHTAIGNNSEDKPETTVRTSPGHTAAKAGTREQLR